MAPPAPQWTNDWHPNTALFISPDLDLGALEGTVTSNGAPVEGVDVQIAGTVFTTETNASGFYEFATLPVGSYEIEFSKYGFETQVHNAIITTNETTMLNVDLVSIPLPSISVSPSELIIPILPGGPFPYDLTITNNGELPLIWNAGIIFPEKAISYPESQGKDRSFAEAERAPDEPQSMPEPSDAIFDLLFQFPVGVGGGE
mgnify:CR=1 FL=1